MNDDDRSELNKSVRNETEKLKERLGKLASCVAVIRVALNK